VENVDTSRTSHKSVHQKDVGNPLDGDAISWGYVQLGIRAAQLTRSALDGDTCSLVDSQCFGREYVQLGIRAAQLTRSALDGDTCCSVDSQCFGRGYVQLS
jgi:hypothetical protein